MKKQSIWVFEWRKSAHYWWSYISFSPECKELTSMLDPLLYRWGVPPVVIRCVHWTMQSGVLQTWIKALGLANVMVTEHFFFATQPKCYDSVDLLILFTLSEMCSERDSPLKRLYWRTHVKLARLAGSGQLVWAAGCKLSLALVHAWRPAWPGETSTANYYYTRSKASQWTKSLLAVTFAFRFMV